MPRPPRLRDCREPSFGDQPIFVVNVVAADEWIENRPEAPALVKWATTLLLSWCSMMVTVSVLAMSGLFGPMFALRLWITAVVSNGVNRFMFCLRMQKVGWLGRATSPSRSRRAGLLGLLAVQRLAVFVLGRSLGFHLPSRVQLDMKKPPRWAAVWWWLLSVAFC